jgi:hypothetical protein
LVLLCMPRISVPILILYLHEDKAEFAQTGKSISFDWKGT